jgi:hypothetical protein
MAAEISREDQAALDLHRIMLEAMRAREGEILRFAAFLLPALGVILASPWVAKVQGKTPPYALLFTTLAVIILLFFGGWYALALSYNYRYLKIVVCRVQDLLRLDRFVPTKWTDPYGKPENRWRKRLKLLSFDFAPEIFRTMVWLFVALILFVCVGFVLISKPCWHPFGWERVVVLVATLVAVVLLELFAARIFPGKLCDLEKRASSGT